MRANRSRGADGWTAGAVVGTILALLASLGSGRPARAQAKPTYEQLGKMYDDAIKELNAAQERKNQLTAENDKLKQTVEDLKKQLDNANSQIADLRRDQADQADKVFFLRSHFAAWEAFMQQYPEMLGRWKAYLQSDFISPRHDEPRILDSGSPTSAES